MYVKVDKWKYVIYKCLSIHCAYTIGYVNCDITQWASDSLVQHLYQGGIYKKQRSEAGQFNEIYLKL